MKKHWKLVLCLTAAALLAWVLWYTRPVDIHGLGMGELEAFMDPRIKDAMKVYGVA